MKNTILHFILFMACSLVLGIPVVDLISENGIWNRGVHNYQFIIFDIALVIAGFYGGFLSMKKLFDFDMSNSEQPIRITYSLEELNIKLEIAIEKEEFEKAAKLRDQIKQTQKEHERWQKLN